MDEVFGTSEGQTARNSATGGGAECVILLTEENVMVDG